MQAYPGQISPGEAFSISYFIRNHTDATTYYVRGVVYDVKTGDILSTHNLAQTATNSRLFKVSATAPADPEGYGRPVVAIATVYTDAGYTTKSESYEEQEQYFLVRAVSPLFGMGGGGGLDVDALRRGIVADVIKALPGLLPKPQPSPEMPSFEGVYGAIGALQREINRVPKESADLAPVLGAIKRVEAAVGDIPEPDKVDLIPVLEGIQNIAISLADLADNLRKDIKISGQALIAEHQKAMEKLVPKITATLQEHLGKQEMTIPFSKIFKTAESDTQQEVDISHLTSV